jgi:lysyl-tRNA synthetase class 2
MEEAVDIESLRERARIIRAIRRFFDERNYLECDTPALAPHLIPETCLEVFKTLLVPPGGSRRNVEERYLVPSPEIWMKQLLARHGVSLYQICKCFRNGESSGRLHSPEFTMLEYYTMGADYLDSLGLTEALFDSLPARAAFPRGPFLRLTVEDAFREYAGFSLEKAALEGTWAMENEARRLGLDPGGGMDRAALYDLIFIHAVEPRLNGERVIALMDYPDFVPCLAKHSPAGHTVERWECYYHGIELANCYSEETDSQAVKAYFEAEGNAKSRALVPHHIDNEYWRIFKKLGACSGVALGLDRLVMALWGVSCIDGVIEFAEQVFPGFASSRAG